MAEATRAISYRDLSPSQRLLASAVRKLQVRLKEEWGFVVEDTDGMFILPSGATGMMRLAKWRAALPQALVFVDERRSVFDHEEMGRQIKENELQHPVLVVTGDLPAMGWEPARLVEAINKLPVDLVILDLAAGWFSDNLRASPYVLGMVDAMVSEARGEWSLFWLGNESRNLGVLMRTKASGGGEG